MLIKNYLLLLSFALISGCSFFAYTPVVTSSALGINKTDLSDKDEYKNFIGRPFQLISTEGNPWKLKRFSGGRYHIEQASKYNKKKEICNLESGNIIVDKIFNDSINGGIYYSAKVICNGQTFATPLNNWSITLKKSIQFLDNDT